MLEASMGLKPVIWLMVAAARCISVLRPASLIIAGLAASTASSIAQGPRPEAIPYCAELRELDNHAMSSQRFAPIIGRPRAGNYRETKLSLTGWNNCAFYGTNTYTCDSAEFTSRDEAAKAQQRIAQEILGCFAGTWAEAPEQMGPDFVVLHPKLGPASITLNMGETDAKSHIISLIMFLRR
jgi:hypothetical protein